MVVIYNIACFYPFNYDYNYYVPPYLTITKSAFCIYVFRMILTVNSDYFLKQR
jgi:hypothetical protein